MYRDAVRSETCGTTRRYGGTFEALGAFNAAFHVLVNEWPATILRERGYVEIVTGSRIIMAMWYL